MQHRVNLYFSDDNPIDAKIWNLLKDKKRRPDIIKSMILGLIETQEIDKISKITVDEEDNLDDFDDNMEGVDFE